MKTMNFKGQEVNYIKVESNFKEGYNFPFIIIIPKNLNDNPDLVYACNLTKDFSKNALSIEELIDLILEDENKFESIDPVMTYLCLEKGNPMVIPFIPRLKDFRPNFLGKDCLFNDFRLVGNDLKFEQDMYMYNNLADQHKSIILTSINYLKNLDISVDEKAILCGYSEGAKFASHLAILHPEIIKAVIAGGTGGAISMPVNKLEGYEFVYPTGVSNLKNFDFESFKNISFFYYIGTEDKSDSAMPYFENYEFINDKGEKELYIDECGNLSPYIDENGKQLFVLDEFGNYTAKFPGMFSDSEVNAINKVLGTKIQERFRKQEQIYNNLGINSVFKLYNGNHHSVMNERNLIFSDIDSFLNNSYCKR